MSKAYTGGCACGAIRYEISAEPIAMNDCQCRDCQSTSGAGHGSYLTFPSREAVKLEGEATLWDMVGDSGNVKTRGFCPACGSPVYLTFSAMPDLFTIHAASLDDPGRYEPQMVTYTVRGHAWDRLDPAYYQIPDEPKSAAPYDLARQPAGNDADHDDDKETLVRKVHGARSFSAVSLGDHSA